MSSGITRKAFRTESQNADDYECKACRCDKPPGQGVLLFGSIGLNAATDDFVFCGFIHFIGRIIQLVLLGIASFIFQFRQTVEDEEEETYNSYALRCGTTAAMLVFMMVCFKRKNYLYIMIILFIIKRTISGVKYSKLR